MIKEKDKKGEAQLWNCMEAHGDNWSMFWSRRRMLKGLPKCQRFVQLKRLHHNWISRWPWFQGMSSTNFQIFYHVKIIVFHTCSLVDFDFAIFHLEGISNEKVYIGGDSKRMWKGEKFQVQKAWVGGGQG